MGLNRKRIAAAACAVLASGALAASAATLDVTGASGADGITGAPGNPGGAGSAGGNGADAVAQANSADASNHMTATAGNGGLGGNGGAGTPPSANGGAGGAGGNAGHAQAEAISVSLDDTNSSAVAIATSGLAGAGGSGGAGGGAGTPGPSGPSGHGGGASANATGFGGLHSSVTAEATDYAGGDVSVQAIVQGGSKSGSGSHGGTATLQSVLGRSTAGGDVRVIGEAKGGTGEIGEGVDLVDAVTGDTSGDLSLAQGALGGDGSGAAGIGSSRMHVVAHSTSASVDAYAGGGRALSSAPLGSNAAANGYAEAQLTNDSGGASAEAGSGGGSAEVGSGGDGEAHSSAVTSGDAHTANSLASASGGLVVSSPGHGGDGHATSLANALGNSAASATTVVRGGRGFTDASQNPGANVGGAAFANARASGAGTSAVSATSQAFGGDSYEQNASTPDHIGTAQAQSLAFGLGKVTASADAYGGGLTAADTRAQSSGRITAAGASITTVPSTNLAAFSATSSIRDVIQRDTVLAQLPYGGPTLARVNADAEGGGAGAAWVSGNPNVQGALSQFHHVSAEGFVRGDPRTGQWTSILSLDLDRQALPLGRDVSLGFLDPSVPMVGFNVLEVHISVGADHIADWVFTSAAAAVAGLDDVLVPIDLDAYGADPISHLVVTFISNTSGAVLPLYSDFVVITHTVHTVPEPGALLLVAAALGIVSFRRHSPR